MSIRLKAISALEKVFPDGKDEFCEISKASMMKNEAYSFQLMFDVCGIKSNEQKLKVSVESALADDITLYLVCNVPVMHANAAANDDWCLRQTLGLYPDMLKKLCDNEVMAFTYAPQSVFVTVNEGQKSIRSGVYPVKIIFTAHNGDKAECTLELEVVDAELDEQSLIATNWVHYDCISVLSGTKLFSDEFFHVMKQYVSLAVKNGQNMILTPAFTPPLDTPIGGDRMTAQLVGIVKNGDKYSFDFSYLLRFIRICTECGMKYFEHSHLFTQWGAKNAPKIIVRENGVEKAYFGWQTDGAGAEYRSFLKQYIAALRQFLTENDCLDRFYFHISDEPHEGCREEYRTACEFVKSCLCGLPTMDAITDGSCAGGDFADNPIIISDKGNEVMGKTDSLWLYYTGLQAHDCYSNRLIAHSGARMRIMGVQLYYYDFKGFLHWGFNAHHTALCKEYFNPNVTTDAFGDFCGGTSFLVYPEADGVAPSLRLEFFRDSMQDFRSLTLLEGLVGREKTLRLIDSVLPDFSLHIKVENQTLLNLREKINAAVKKAKSLPKT